jgi:hypothetical protein
MEEIELFQPQNLRSAPGQFTTGRRSHRPQANDDDIEMVRHAKEELASHYLSAEDADGLSTIRTVQDMGYWRGWVADSTEDTYRFRAQWGVGWMFGSERGRRNCLQFARSAIAVCTTRRAAVGILSISSARG